MSTSPLYMHTPCRLSLLVAEETDNGPVVFDASFYRATDYVAIGDPCPICGEPLTMDNLTLVQDNGPKVLDATTVNNPQLVIKMNNTAANDPCGICGKRTDPNIGPDIFIDGTQKPVCAECAAEHAPVLYSMVALWSEQQHPADPDSTF